MFGGDDEYHQFTTTSSFPIPSADNHFHPSSLHNNPLVRSTDELVKLRSTNWEHVSRKLNSYKDFSELDELYPNTEQQEVGIEDKKRKKKRKYKFQEFMDLIDDIVSKMLSQQEEMHNKLIEEVVKRDEESIAREEERKSQEMDRFKMEIQLREREQACAEERQATIIHFLNNLQTPPNPTPSPHSDSCTPSSHNQGKRWPKDEVLALINLRCKNGRDGPLWERISQGMMELGYKRSAKRCKEKWENINKYFRKTKDSNKKRSLESRTCPYFQQLACLYTQGTIVAPQDKHDTITN